jgi:hypothetical protein
MMNMSNQSPIGSPIKGTPGTNKMGGFNTGNLSTSLSPI